MTDRIAEIRERLGPPYQRQTLLVSYTDVDWLLTRIEEAERVMEMLVEASRSPGTVGGECTCGACNAARRFLEGE